MLEPLLFLVYINDILEFCCDSTAILFADGAVLMQNAYSSEESFEEPIESVADYFLRNKLTLNLEKTDLVNLKAIRKSSEQEIKLQNDAISQKKSPKYLGVQIDEKLGYVKPIITYGVLVYGTSTKTTRLPPEAKTKRIARIIFKKIETESTEKRRKV